MFRVNYLFIINATKLVHVFIHAEDIRKITKCMLVIYNLRCLICDPNNAFLWLTI